MALFYDEAKPVIKTDSVNSKENAVVAYTPGIYIPKDVEQRSLMDLANNSILEEQFKGLIQQEKKIPYEDVGEPLPYGMDIEVLQGVYVNFGLVTGVVDKFVDFVISPGFHVKSDDGRAQKIIEDFKKDHNLDILLRNWLRDALVCGNGYMELADEKNKGSITKMKILNPKNMFLKRDIYGNLLFFTQYFGNIPVMNSGAMEGYQQKIQFKSNEIAHFAYNKIGDNAYGIGIVYPAMDTMNKFLKAQKDMHKILERKANSQIHVKMGDPASGRVPTPEVVTAFGQKLHYMNEKTEWVTDCYVDMKTIDFGNVSDKFTGVLENDYDLMFFTFQVPEVLMGRGSIPEGLANVQLDAFQRRVKSIQTEMGRIIETQIFKRVLKSQGIDADIQIQWGEQSDDDKRAEITILTTLLQNPMLGNELRVNIENKLALLLGFTEKIETPEKEKERELTKDKIPQVPGQQKMIPRPINNNIQLCNQEKIYKGILRW